MLLGTPGEASTPPDLIPDLCLLEVANALRRRRLTDRRFTRTHLREAVADPLALRPVVVSSAALIEAAIDDADFLTTCDASYLAVAAAWRLPLCTLHAPLAGAAQAEGLEVLVPGTQAFAVWPGQARG